MDTLAKEKERRKEYHREYWIKNRERLILHNKEYASNNKEKTYLRHKKYTEKNRDKVNQWNQISRETHRESRREYQEIYRKAYPEKLSLWKEKNKEKIKEYNRNYEKQKRIDDPLYYFKSKVRIFIKSSFKRKNKRKQSRTEEILGCSVKYFIEYLLSKCPEGTTLSEFTIKGYHIDHIIPLSTANTEEEIIKLCHYTNLQPLWWIENLKKSNKI